MNNNLNQKQDPQSDKDDISSNLGYLDEPDQAAKESSEKQEQRKRQWREKAKPKKYVPPVQVKKQKYVQPVQSNTEGIFLYKPGVQLPNLYPFMNNNIKIIIASEFINKSNPQYIKRNVIGNQAYTSNSDALCIACHSGSINIQTFNHKKYEGVELVCKVIRPKKNYIGITKYGITSKGIKGYDGNALKIESVKNLPSLGSPQLLYKYAANMHIPIGTKRTKSKPRNLSSVIPIPQTHIVFNMNNEPAYKYSIFNIADKGFEKNDWVIKKLDHSSLYLEGEDVKYEIYKRCEKEYFDIFRFSILKAPEKADNQFFSKYPPPLNEELIEIVYDDLEWQQILWGNKTIKVRDKEFTGLRSFKYYKNDTKK